MKEIAVREDVERMNFEAWYKAKTGITRLETIVDDGDVYYDNVSIDYTWQGWLARAYESAKEKEEARK